MRAYVTETQLALGALGQQARVTVDAGDSAADARRHVSWVASQAEFTPTPIQTRDERADLVYAVKIRVPNQNGAAQDRHAGRRRVRSGWSDAMNAVAVEALTKTFRDDAGARSASSFAVAPGELFGFIGPDGAGKTTLFRILVTLLVPDAGRASVLGRDVVTRLLGAPRSASATCPGASRSIPT